MADPLGSQMETRKEVDDQPDHSRYWLAELDLAGTRQTKWHKRGKAVLERYRDERDEVNKNHKKVNILWANTEVLKAALFAQLGNPDVRRNFPLPGEQNKIARQTALMLERALSVGCSASDEEHEIECAVEDMLLPGRGQCWVEYEVEFETPEGDQEVEDGLAEGMESEAPENGHGAPGIKFQEVSVCYVPWEDFRHGPGSRFKDWPWGARRHMWTRDELVEKFPEHGKRIPLGYVMDGCKKDEQDEMFRRAAVWEVWDKTQKERLYIAEEYELVLKRDADPLNLDGFFPFPRPLDAIKPTSDAFPIPEYCEYQDQAMELDRVTSRIYRLTELMKWAGVYDDSMPDVEKIMDVGYLEDGQFAPLKGAAAYRDVGGLEKAMFSIPIDKMAAALAQLYQQRAQLIQTIYEVTGISDLVRGFSEGSKTATEQSLKAKFGSQRMQKRQKEVQRFVRDLYRIKGEIIAEHFEREQLQAMTGILLPTKKEKMQAQMVLQRAQQVQQMQQQMAEMAKQQQQAGQAQPPQGLPAPQGAPQAAMQ